MHSLSASGRRILFLASIRDQAIIVRPIVSSASMRPWAIPPVFPVTSVDVDGFLCLEGSVPCSVRYELGMSTSRRSV